MEERGEKRSQVDLPVESSEEGAGFISVVKDDAGRQIRMSSDPSLLSSAEESETQPSSESPKESSKLDFLWDIAQQYEEEGSFKDAERVYLRLLKENPTHYGVQCKLSTLYLVVEDYEKALPMLTALATEFPDDPRHHNNLAWAYATGAGVKDYEKALRMLTALVTEFPDDPRHHNNLAWAYATGAGVKDYEKALRYAREALLLAPNMPHLWNTLAEAYYIGADYDKALRSSERALELLESNSPIVEEFQAQQEKIIRAQKMQTLMEEFRIGK
jgi:tetratricopeptide (TPR) repeat protein